MGLESYNMAYRPERVEDLDATISLLLNDFGAITKLSDEPKYIIKSDMYLIDILRLNVSISIRVALCCSVASIDAVFDIFKKISSRYGGSFFDQHTKINSKEFSADELEKIKISYLERQNYFFDNVAFIKDVPLSADAVYKYMRDNDVKPRITVSDS